MASLGKRCLKVLLAAGFGLLSGCFGVTQNPSYFPYLLPTGDIIQTHAKPGFGYYANFDPHATDQGGVLREGKSQSSAVTFGERGSDTALLRRIKWHNCFDARGPAFDVQLYEALEVGEDGNITPRFFRQDFIHDLAGLVFVQHAINLRASEKFFRVAASSFGNLHSVTARMMCAGTAAVRELISVKVSVSCAIFFPFTQAGWKRCPTLVAASPR